MKIPALTVHASVAVMSALSSADAAVYTVYSSTVDVGSSYTNIDVSMFNSSLGTLTGVQVSVVQSLLTGSADVTNTAVVSTTLDAFDSTFTVKGVTSGLGYATTNATMYDVVTTPAWNSITINPSNTVTLTAADGQSFSIGSQSVAADSFSTYRSVGGSGVVTFAAKNTKSITTTGGSYSVNTNSVKTTTQLAVSYTYTATPVPEPNGGLVGVSVMGLAWLVLDRRRQKRNSRR